MIYRHLTRFFIHIGLHVFTWKLREKLRPRKNHLISLCEILIRGRQGVLLESSFLFKILFTKAECLWMRIKTKFQSERFQSCSVQISRNSLELTCFLSQPDDGFTNFFASLTTWEIDKSFKKTEKRPVFQKPKGDFSHGRCSHGAHASCFSGI